MIIAYAFIVYVELKMEFIKLTLVSFLILLFLGRHRI